MISDRDLNELLKGALAGQAQEPQLAPEEAEAEKARLRALGAGMTPEQGVEMPKGTKVVFSPDSAMGPESAAARQPIIPKVVDLTKQPMDDFEMAYAKRADYDARAREAFERGSRELVAGLTRTPVAGTFEQPKDAVSKLLAKRKEREASRLQDNAQRLEASKYDYERKSQAQKDAEARARDERDFKFRTEESARDNERAERHNATNEKLAAAMAGLRIDEANTKKTERGEKAAANEVPLFDGVVSLSPGLSDSERSKARGDAAAWNAADAATGQLEEAIQAYVANPSAQTKAAVDAKVASAASSLNSALGQGAMANDEFRRMTSTLGADLTSPAGIKAVIDSVTGSPEAGQLLLSRLRSARDANRASARARLGTYSQAKPQAAPSAMSAEDKAALDWANANPKDPRAAAIKQKLGVR